MPSGDTSSFASSLCMRFHTLRSCKLVSSSGASALDKATDCHSRSTQLSQSSIGGVAHTRLPASRCRSAYSRRSQRAARTFAVRTVAPLSNALSISMGSRIKP